MKFMGPIPVPHPLTHQGEIWCVYDVFFRIKFHLDWRIVSPHHQFWNIWGIPYPGPVTDQKEIFTCYSEPVMWSFTSNYKIG